MGALVMETVDEIYLDNAATSWPKPEAVYQAIDHYNRRVGASPGRGSHSRTIAAGQLVLNTREKLAELFNIKDSSRIIFTENVTMAINIGLKGLLEPGDHVVISSMEHNAVARPIHALKDSGVIDLTIIQCAADGSLDPCLVEQAITEKTRLVCLLHASNLTGTIMPIDAVGEIAYDNGVLFMVDAAQTAFTTAAVLPNSNLTFSLSGAIPFSLNLLSITSWVPEPASLTINGSSRISSKATELLFAK
jgi:selenocysteine lyase/cysteine desulfurase